MRKITPTNEATQAERAEKLMNAITTAEEYVEPENWTIISAMDRVISQVETLGLCDAIFQQCKNPLDYLTTTLHMTPAQTILLGLLIENGEPMTWRAIGQALKRTRLSVMILTDEMEGLISSGWLYRCVAREGPSRYEAFALSRGVVKALRMNEVFVPEKIDNLTEQEFIDKIVRRITRSFFSPDSHFEYDEEWIDRLIKANPQLPLCQAALRMNSIHDRTLLMLIVVDYAKWMGTEDEGLSFDTIDEYYTNDFECDDMRFSLREGTHPLIKEGIIEQKCDAGIVDVNSYQLTRDAKEKLVAHYTPLHSKPNPNGQNQNNLRSHGSITAKPLFFNATDQEQIDRLTTLLGQDSLTSVQQRLEEQGMRKGVACLFYGAPGTGKTETVLQLARQTGRDIMQVDIAGLRDKYVGESEKNIKAVFTRYRNICKNAEVLPILFFNEADAILGKRTEHVDSSVAKMDNAMQNIILQELEDLDGIFIATTNLTANLDTAFERRFLFKIEFHKPDTEVKAKIWATMLKNISEAEAYALATAYDFSGGQIENIARKRTIDYIISGQYATLDGIRGYCQHELLMNDKQPHPIAGFGH